MRGWAEALRFRAAQESGKRPGVGDERIVRGEELAQVLALDVVRAAPEAVFQAIWVAGRRAAFSVGGELNVGI